MRQLEVHGKHSLGKIVLVDEGDFDRLRRYRWRVDARGYVCTSYNVSGRYICVYLHQAVLGKRCGLHIDHIDHNPLNNCKSNLRFATVSENIHNAQRKTPTSGFRGVSWHATQKQWRARIKLRGREVFIGWFDTAEEASEAYETYRQNNSI